MKKIILYLLIVSAATVKSQLPPQAQTLYNTFFNSNTVAAQYCNSAGVTASATGDGKTFYIKWFPAGITPSNSPMMVHLHGTNGNVFVEMQKLLPTAQTRSVGIIALQWYLGPSSTAPNDYFGDTTLYKYIDTALKRIKYPSNKALLSGFSRGSARSYAIQYLDVYPPIGKNYFCTIMSNAGKPDSLYPFYTSINAATNHTFCTGKRWAMYCGVNDPNPARDGCVGMNSAKNNWVIPNGGTVGLYIQNNTLPSSTAHTGFMDTPIYIDSLLKYYLTCHSGSTSNLKENSFGNIIKLHPNPTKDFIYLTKKENSKELIKIYNSMGKLVREVTLEGIETKINIVDLPTGLYFILTDRTRLQFLKE